MYTYTMRRYFILTLLVTLSFLVLLIVVKQWTLLSSPTPPINYTYDATQGWKWYQNSYFGISFEHPISLPAEELKDQHRLIIPYNNGYMIDITKYETNDDIPTWWEKNKDNFLPYDISPVSFNGKRGYKLTLTTLDAQVPMDQYLVVNNEGIIAIAYQTTYRIDLMEPDSTVPYKQVNEEYSTTIQLIIERILGSMTFSD